MPEGLWTYLQERSLPELARDVLDFVVVYYVLYRALLVLRGTRAIQVGIGLGLIFLLYVVAQELQLVTLSSILGALIPGAAILIIVVVFQNDIRRALMRMGSQPFMGWSKARELRAIDEVVEAATDLARHRTGAIIAFEQDANLDEFVGANKGHEIDAAVSSELLVSMFIPDAMNKLHDGAVIIRDLRIAKAGVFFPMPDTRVVDASFGSRHRAALGITEETDAVVVVVSEERGSISFCFNGNIVGNLDGPGLRRALEGVFTPKSRKRRAPRTVSREGPTPSPAEITSPSLATVSPEQTPTPISASVESTPTARLKAVEPEPAKPEEVPQPLRKAKSDSIDTQTGKLPAAAPRGAPVPLRPATAERPDTRLKPKVPAERTPRPARSPEESVPDSTEKGEPS